MMNSKVLRQMILAAIVASISNPVLGQTVEKVYDNLDRSRALKVNDDGSVDAYFDPKAPAGMENNWLQTIPGKG